MIISSRTLAVDIRNRIEVLHLLFKFVMFSFWKTNIFLCLCIFKNGPTPASFIIYFRSFQTLRFLQQYVKNIHPVHSAGIQTHNLLEVSLLL